LKACSPWVRGTIAAGALALAAMLAGCETDGVDISEKALKPLSPAMVAELERKHMPKETPILVRLFKEEAELEIWKQDDSGRFALLATYPVCRWSGELGPKVKQGDRQAPEGFYTITPAQLNPNSHYYLSVDIGYPNAFDRAYGRTGSNLMIHGDCSSAGCYAMTDEQIGEIYALARESFFGGQRAFQLQAYPFRMTPINMAKHRNNPNMPFWKMIKEGYDHFEVTRQEPKVDFCEKKYVFDAVKAPDAKRDPVFEASAKCPAYVIPDEVAEAVRDRQQQEQAEVAKLIEKGTPVARLNTGIDGGMNKVFAARVPNGSTGLSEGGEGQGLSLLTMARAPGTIPATVNPPHGPVTSPQEPLVASMAPAPTPAPATRVASAAPNAQSDGFFSNLARKVGLSGAIAADTTASAPSGPAVPAKPKVVEAKRNEPAALAKASKPETSKPETSKPDTKQAAARPPLKPSVSDTAAASAPEPAAKDAVVAGSAPIVQANSFESRFSAVK